MKNTPHLFKCKYKQVYFINQIFSKINLYTIITGNNLK